MIRIMETKRLAIQGKVITFNDVQGKSLAQFKQQLKQNGVTVADETAERLWCNLRGELTEEQKAAKAEAEAKAKAAREAAEAKFNANKKGE